MTEFLVRGRFASIHRRSPRASHGAFTLIELLVVIGIIGVLIAILLPAMQVVRRYQQTISCATQLRQIGIAVRAYVDANKGYIHKAPIGTGWLANWQPPGEPTSALRLISPNAAATAYWGSAYLPYTSSRGIAQATGTETPQIIAAARNLWLCPSSKRVTPESVETDPSWPVSYGFNMRLCDGFAETSFVNGVPLLGQTTWQKIGKFRWPSTTILCHDAFRATLSKNEQDGLSDFATTTNGVLMNLTAFRPEFSPTKTDGVSEYYRHNRRSQVLWVDGHVSLIGYSTGSDVPFYWYRAKQAGYKMR